MDGLECSEVSFGYIKGLSEILRLDSYYYAKEFIKDENLLNEISNKKIKEIGATIRSFGAYSLNNEVVYQNDGVPFIRGVNMKNGLVDFHNLLYISPSANKLLWKSEVFPNTILLSMSGSLGDVAIARENWQYPINSNQDIAKIEFGDNINPYYIYTFLKSRYGQNYIRREARGSVQQHVFLSQIEQFKIPILSSAFQLSIEHIVREAYSKNDCSSNIYHWAEKSILKYICLDDMYSTENNKCIKSYKTSYCKTNRLDAEYYQPKYDELFNQLENLKTYKLGDIVNIKKSIEPGSAEYRDVGIPFVRVSDLSEFGISETHIHLDRIPYAYMGLQPKKNTILFSKDGSVGIAYKTENDLDIITSGAILHLEIKTKLFLPDYLTLVLNSLIVKMQAERDAGGSIIQHWKPSEIENVIIPWLPMDKQKEIADKIQESFSLRKQSNALLERAKTAVEMAIEQGEETALGWLQEMDKNQST